MSYSDPMKLFSVLKERAQSNSSGGFGNQNILKLKSGNSYTLRLLWLPSDTREYPMINQYVHRVWDDNAIGSKDVHVICPTSQYDQDGAGFRSCPICARMSELYKESQNGSASANELYSKFKRTLRGFVPVYVVKGPAQDLHKVKILQYSILFKKYFDEKIFGIHMASKDQERPQEDFDESNLIGINAFMYYDPKKDQVVTTGHNFIVNVGTKKVPINNRMVEMPDYKLDFSMKPTDIEDFNGDEITVDYFKNLSNELGFDRDFFEMSNVDALIRFKAKYIDGNDDDVIEEKPVEDEEDDFDIEVPKTAPKAKKVVEEEAEETVEEPEEVVKPALKKAEKKTAPKPAPKEEPEEEADDAGEKDDDDIDIDALLADI